MTSEKIFGEKTPRELRKRIVEAFATVDSPEEDLLDNPDSCEDAQAVDSLLGKTWRELQFEDFPDSIQELLDSLAPRAFLYFLPGFLAILLRDSSEDTYPLPHALTEHFIARWWDPDSIVFLKERVLKEFSSDQREVMREALNLPIFTELVDEEYLGLAQESLRTGCLQKLPR